MKSVGQCHVMTRQMTPQQAANHAKVGRTTIMQALKSQELKGIQSNNGRWKITEEALEDWMSLRPDSDRSPRQKSTDIDSVNVSSELIEAKVEIAKLTAEKAGLEARLLDAHAERDRLSEALKIALEPGPRLSFWRRFF